jgi:hypothetical protein
MCQLPAISAWRHAPMLCWSRKHRPKAKCPGQSTSYGAKECAIQSRTQWIEEIVALIPYDDNHDQAEDYPEYFLSGEDSFVAVYLPCRIFFRRRWRLRTWLRDFRNATKKFCRAPPVSKALTPHIVGGHQLCGLQERIEFSLADRPDLLPISRDVPRALHRTPQRRLLVRAIITVLAETRISHC